jgi:hypothetical protein
MHLSGDPARFAAGWSEVQSEDPDARAGIATDRRRAAAVPEIVDEQLADPVPRTRNCRCPPVVTVPYRNTGVGTARGTTLVLKRDQRGLSTGRSKRTFRQPRTDRRAARDWGWPGLAALRAHHCIQNPMPMHSVASTSITDTVDPVLIRSLVCRVERTARKAVNRHVVHWPCSPYINNAPQFPQTKSTV